jgi:pectin methylesterase-like acyl-CoA thioesterase
MKRAFFYVTHAMALIALGYLAVGIAGKILPSQQAQATFSVLPVAISFGDAAPAAESASAPGFRSTSSLPLSPLAPAGSGFTYQGRLASSGSPANGLFDLVFTLFDDPSTGTVVSTPVTLTNQTVTGGLFTVTLDFGSSSFDGNARYMGIAVRQSGGGPYTALAPRQPITPAPYALFALKTQPYKNVVVVAQSGGQYTTISAALAAITNNSTTNRYLIRVAPGTYSEQVTMKQWVDIEGSGEKNTKITFTGSIFANTGTVVGASNAELRSLSVENTGGNTWAIPIYNSNASPSLLHVTAIGSGGTFNYGVYNVAVGSLPTMTNVTATGSGGTYNYGVYNFDGSPRIAGSVINGSGGTESYGIYNIGIAQVTVDNSKVTGGTNSIYNNAGDTMRVGASQLSGGSAFNGGTLTCSASYDGNNRRLGTDCTHNTKIAIVGIADSDYTSITAALGDTATWCGIPSATNQCLVRVGPGTYTEHVVMKQYVDIEGAGEQSTKITFTGGPSLTTGTVVGASNAELRSLTVENTGGSFNAVAIYNSGASPSLLHVTAVASGATGTKYGIVNLNSSPTINNVIAIASGASSNYGIYNESGSSPTINNVIVTASGGSFNCGVLNNLGFLTMNNVAISASGGYGLYNTGAGTATISSSKITASIYTIANQSGTTTKIVASQLVGGAVGNAGTLICTASYDGNNKRLGTDCTPLTRVAVVGITDGDYSSIGAALADVATWCGTPYATNRCLVRAGPGIYSGQVTMQQYVDIEGSGEQQTKLTFGGSLAQNTGTVVGASNAELRSLTVENTGGNNYATAIYNSGASPSLRNVTVLASGASGMSSGVINFASSSSSMTNVTVSVAGASDNRGVLNDSSSARIVGSNISTSGGTFSFGVSSYTAGTVTIDSSKISGNTNTVFNSAATTRVGASQLSGGPVLNNSGGTLTCSASYDENYVSPGLNVGP